MAAATRCVIISSAFVEVSASRCGRPWFSLAIRSIRVAIVSWEGLVLELDRGDAGRLELAHGANDVDRGAVAGVGVGDQRHLAEGPHKHAGPLGHLGLGDQADVREAKPATAIPAPVM
jgi:hypothetical protein